MRTPENKRVRTEYLMGCIDYCPVGESIQDQLIDSILFQMDVRVIGWHMENEMQMVSTALSEFDDCRASVFLGRGAAGDLNNRWAVLHTSYHAYPTSGNSLAQSLVEVEDVMFPDGHGFDIDEGEAVYLYATMRNSCAVAIPHICGTCVLYYVKR